MALSQCFLPSPLLRGAEHGEKTGAVDGREADLSREPEQQADSGRGESRAEGRPGECHRGGQGSTRFLSGFGVRLERMEMGKARITEERGSVLTRAGV